MPLLNRILRHSVPRELEADPPLPADSRREGPPVFSASQRKRHVLSTCANPSCASGWLHLLRSRSSPVFENGWTCSPACTLARIDVALRRELDSRVRAEEYHRHRIPLGLLMLEQGWISSHQLRQALESQRAVGAGKLGQWLIRQQRVSEQLVTRALGLQWSCPVLPLEYHDPQSLTGLVPRLFIDAFGALPLRVAGGKLLYLGFEERLDLVLALAIARMTGLRVECGLVRESEFRPALARMLNLSFPVAELVESAAEPALARTFAEAIERTKPVESTLVRVHDCLWLRMWRRPQPGAVPLPGCVHDLIGSVRLS